MMRPLTALAASAFFIHSAAAQLSGQNLAADWWFDRPGVILEHHSILVGPDLELNAQDILHDDNFVIDVADQTVTFRFTAATRWASGQFNGWHFADLDGTLPPILSYAVESATPGIGNAAAIRCIHDENSFGASFSSIRVAGPGESITLRVTFSTCPHDFNRDGFLDFFDYQDFVDCFEGGPCPQGRTPDFNADGMADFFDYTDFVEGFEAGC